MASKAKLIKKDGTTCIVTAKEAARIPRAERSFRCLGKDSNGNPIEYRKIICLETMEIFDKPNDACLKYGESKNVPMIIKACKEMRPALKDEFGNKLHWMYYDEYLEKIENGEKIIYHKNQNVKKVICVTTGKIFDKVKDAGLYYDVKPTSISACCKKKIHSAGKTLDGTPLYWMYYDEYSNTEDNIIIPEKKHCKQKIKHYCRSNGRG